MSDFRFYQLSRDPFDKSIPASEAHETRDLREACGRLDFLARAGGVGLVTAQPGFGKTFAVRRWASLAPRDVDVRYVCLTTVTTMEFYRQLCHALSVEASYKKVDMFRDIQAHLRRQALEKRVRTVVAVDEAQYLSGPILRDLTMLTNFDMDSRSCVAFALVGLPYTADVLCRGAHEALRQRIVVSYAFSGLSEAEAREYVAHMLRAAGGSPDTISEAAVLAAHGISGGSVRRLGTILSTALRIGAQNRAPQVDAEMVLSASQEVSLR
ncbi:MAG: AAA family ATPase [Atopobiaceae bacterium]|nr:AAA family ATPase [Atopobiaceae bacterium]